MLAADRDALPLIHNVCPECGGRFVDGLTCQEMFGVLLAWEWQDPELLGVHFFTVGSYLLQHPAPLTGKAVSGLRTAFARVLSGEVTIQQVRAQTASAYDGATRVRRPVREIRPVPRTWSMTVADVYAGGQSGAAGRVKTWAQVIHSEIGERSTQEVSDQG